MKLEVFRSAALIVVLTAAVGASAQAQEVTAGPAGQTLSVFLDCNGRSCDRIIFGGKSRG